MTPGVSVVLVSDHRAGSPEAWAETRAAFRALAAEDPGEPVEFILVEHAQLLAGIPENLRADSRLRLVADEGPSANSLRNAGVRAARHDLVAVIDADCLPARGWLVAAVQALRRQPEATVVGGRTVYSDPRAVVRALSLLTRGFRDPGGDAVQCVRRISHEAAVWRTKAWLENPHVDDAGPLSADLHLEPLIRAGHVLLFEPRMVVAHAFGGWRGELDLRRHRGFIAFNSRRREPRLRAAWVARLGLFAIPIFCGAFVLRDLSITLRHYRRYGLRWFELPLAFGLCFAFRPLEVPGMLDALRRRPVQGSYRR